MFLYKSGCYLDSVYKGTFNYITSNFDYSTYKGGDTKISGFALSIAYRKYKNELAPLGLYVGYFLGFGSSSAMVHSSTTDSTVFTKAHAITPKFGYVYGRQNIFFDKVIVDRGFSFDMIGLLLGVFGKNRNQQNSNTGSAIADPIVSFEKQIKT